MSRTISFLFFLLSLLLLTAQARAQTRQRQTAARAVEASRFAGPDIGARINAADRSLGAASGEIVARGGGRITTQIVVSGGHTLRLMPGTYAPVTTEIPILLKPGASVVGACWDQSVVLESTEPGQFVGISSYSNDHRHRDSGS